MRPSVLLTTLFSASCLAQGDLAGLLASQPDLSTLLDLVQLTHFSSVLSTMSNITIIAPTNQAFDTIIPPVIPERTAVLDRNTSSVAGLLANHVFQGYYPSDAVGEDIRLGDGIIIHVVDTVMKLGPTVQQFAARNEDLGALVTALDAAELTTGPNMGRLNAADIAVLLPIDAAFQAIGSVVAGADAATLNSVLLHHVVPSNIIFSPSISNVSVPSLEGSDLTFLVTPEGDIFVNQAKVILPNVILFNGAAHIIDSVLNPDSPAFDRASLNASAAASARVGFPSATFSTVLPLTSVSSTDITTYTTPAIFTTAPAVSVTGVSGTITATSNGTMTMSATPAPYTGAAVMKGVGLAAGAGCVLGAIAALA